MLSKCYVAFLFVSALPLLAHHQFSSEFDKGKAMSLSGTVTRVDWAKPHGHIYLTVKNQSGKNEQWKLEIAGSDYLAKQGLTSSSFKKGEQITVSAYGDTNEPRVASARQVTTADGKSVQVADA
jgi:hypothetical protein